jgi:rhodanese-related sulfurtransferase
MAGVKEVNLEEALDFARKHNTKLVWLGREPVEYIRDLLQLDERMLVAYDPNLIVNGEKEDVVRFKNHIFVCYHGNTSRYIVNVLKENCSVEALNLKGGITAIVGEIF